MTFLFQPKINRIELDDGSVLMTPNRCGFRLFANSATVQVPIAATELCASWLTERKYCARCLAAYIERDNFVKACSYHPMPVSSATGTHICCGKRTALSGYGGYNGCVRCDHSTQMHWSSDLLASADKVDSSCIVTMLPDCMIAMLASVGVQVDVVAHIDSWTSETTTPLNALLTRTVLVPHSHTARVSRVDWPFVAVNVPRFSALNDQLRFEEENIDYYTQARREFIPYSLVLRIATGGTGFV